MEGKVNQYSELSWKEKMALYKEFGKTVNPRSKIRTVIFIISAIAMFIALLLIMIHLQGSLWFEASFPILCNIGWWLLLPTACLTLYFMGQEIERNRGFNKWLEKEKNIIKKPFKSNKSMGR